MWTNPIRRITYADPHKIDIGCKTYTKRGFTGIDYMDFGQNVVWDVRHGLPFPDNSINEVYSRHFVEHLADEDIEGFFYELGRVCMDGARIEIIIPHRDSVGSWTHNHLSWWCEDRFKGIATSYASGIFEILELGSSVNDRSGQKEVRALIKVVKQKSDNTADTSEVK